MDPGRTLEQLEAEQPSRVFYDGHRDRPMIPLMLRLGVEHDAVVEDLVSQVEKVVDLVRNQPPTVPLADVPAGAAAVGETDV